jgi:plastocyanin
MLRQTLVAVSLLVAAAGGASAQTLTGKIEDPGLRRKVQLVYVEKVDGKTAASKAPTVITQHGNVYLPHVVPVVVGTQVVFKSEDPELHNVFARGDKKVLFNDAVLPQMQSAPKTFTEAGVVHLTCNVHKEMSAYVIVLQNKFFATPQKDGTFTISGLPPGSYTVRVWGESLTPEQLKTTFQLQSGGAS